MRSGLSERPRRGSRIAPLWLTGLVLLSSACVATKSDVRKLQGELAVSRARQDSLHRELQREMQRQDRMLLDTLRNSFDFARNMSGTINNQLRELRETVRTLEALLGQTQQRIAEAQRQQELLRQQTVPQPVSPAQRAADNPDSLYATGMLKLADRSIATARLIFEQILLDFPQHARAPDAQYQLAETYYLERDYARSYQELERVVEMYPTSPRAPSALYRAGVIAEEQRERDRARRYYTRVVNQYRTSDEAEQAQRRLRALR